MRLPAQERKDLLRRGRRKAHDFLTVMIMPNKKPHHRIAVIVPKTAINKATQRNRLRRQLQEALRHKAQTSVRAYDIVVVARKPSRATQKSSYIKSAFDHLGV